MKATIATLPAAVLEELRRRVMPVSSPVAEFVPPLLPDAGELDRRIRGYLDRVGSRSEGARNKTAFKLAAWLTRDMSQPTETAWAYLREWNRGNTPTLPERELIVVFRQALKSAKRAKGCGLGRRESEKPFQQSYGSEPFRHKYGSLR